MHTLTSLTVQRLYKDQGGRDNVVLNNMQISLKGERKHYIYGYTTLLELNTLLFNQNKIKDTIILKKKLQIINMANTTPSKYATKNSPQQNLALLFACKLLSPFHPAPELKSSRHENAPC